MTLKRLALALMLTLLTPSAWAASISLQAEDGTALVADAEGEGVHGVLLVHGKDRSRADWGPYARKLASKGFLVVALDLRGHGESSGGASEADFPKMTGDVAAAVAYLKGRGAEKITIIGAELGANLAANVAADNDQVTNLILLSAGMNIAGVKAGAALETYGERPVLIVTSDEDAYANRSAAYLEGKAKGVKHVETLSGAGAGVKMLTRDPQLEGIVLAWLNGTFFLTQGSDADGQQKALNTSDVTKIETTGTRFGDEREETKKAPEAPLKELDLDD